MSKHASTDPHAWIEQAFPQLHYLLLALDGDAAASRWLDGNSPGVALLARAIDGAAASAAGLERGPAAGGDEQFELIANEDLAAYRGQRHPGLYRLFAAVKGDADALERLGRKHARLARLVSPLR